MAVCLCLSACLSVCLSLSARLLPNTPTNTIQDWTSAGLILPSRCGEKATAELWTKPPITHVGSGVKGRNCSVHTACSTSVVNAVKCWKLPPHAAKLWARGLDLRAACRRPGSTASRPQAVGQAPASGHLYRLPVMRLAPPRSFRCRRPLIINVSRSKRVRCMRIPVLPTPQRAPKIPADPENFGAFGGEWSGACLYFRVHSNPTVPYTKFRTTVEDEDPKYFLIGTSSSGSY